MMMSYRPIVDVIGAFFGLCQTAQVGHSGAPVAAYREQMVEIALGGPKSR